MSSFDAVSASAAKHMRCVSTLHSTARRLDICHAHGKTVTDGPCPSPKLSPACSQGQGGQGTEPRNKQLTVTEHFTKPRGCCSEKKPLLDVCLSHAVHTPYSQVCAPTCMLYTSTCACCVAWHPMPELGVGPGDYARCQSRFQQGAGTKAKRQFAARELQNWPSGRRRKRAGWTASCFKLRRAC